MTNYVLALCAAVGAVVYLFTTSQLPQGGISDPLGAKAFPYLVGIGLLCSALVMGFEAYRGRAGASALQPAVPATVLTETDPSIERKARRVLIAMAAWTFVYYVSFEPAGYVLATTIYLIGLLSFLNRGRMKLNVAVALGFTVVSYIIFAKLLGVNLPSGVLGF